jgi:hypothetical protein
MNFHDIQTKGCVLYTNNYDKTVVLLFEVQINLIHFEENHK